MIGGQNGSADIRRRQPNFRCNRISMKWLCGARCGLTWR